LSFGNDVDFKYQFLEQLASSYFDACCLFQIYCSEMAGSDPKEYLSLVASENENYSEVYEKKYEFAFLRGTLRVLILKSEYLHKHLTDN
jgi:GON domain